GGRTGGAGTGHHRARGALVVAEIALSLVLLVAAGLLLRSFVLLQQVTAGMSAPPENVLTMQISPSAARYSDPKVITAFYQQILDNVRHLTSVEAAAGPDPR